MNTGHHGPWQKVGVPANLLERWRHGSAEHLRPLASKSRFSVPAGPPGFMSAVGRAGRTKMATRLRYRRRRGGRRRGRRRNYRSRIGMPFKVVRRLKTSVYYAINPGAGTIAVGVLNLNSAQDPTGTFGTGQPLAHDQYSSLYERCAVIGGSVFIEATSADGTNPIALGINVQPSPTTLTTYEHYRELPHTSFKIMTPDLDKVTLGTRFGVGRYFGHRKILSDDRLSAAIGSEPTDLLYGHVFAQSLDKTADAAVIHAVVTITQTIVYFKPKAPARS